MMEEASNQEVTLLEGFDVAILGYAERFGMSTSVCYDRDTVIDIITKTRGVTREMAEEHFTINIVGAHFGDTTPVFVTIDPYLEH
jgi:tRNA U34 5-carboxymethylaminomethyl modifying GTPase MnmE/TrmE